MIPKSQMLMSNCAGPKLNNLTLTLTLTTIYFLQFPDNLPCSVGLQPGPNDSGKVKHKRGIQAVQPLLLWIGRWTGAIIS